tara:strand:- start:306 stop:602 length:297 start_codon:yes stop_codon:yes gene_type:complete
MAPTIKEGDLIIFKPYDHYESKLIIGDIVVAKNPLKGSQLIIKRLSKKDVYGVELLGDNEYLSTDSRHFGLINYKELVGIVDRIIPRSTKIIKSIAQE